MNSYGESKRAQNLTAVPAEGADSVRSRHRRSSKIYVILARTIPLHEVVLRSIPNKGIIHGSICNSPVFVDAQKRCGYFVKNGPERIHAGVTIGCRYVAWTGDVALDVVELLL